MHSVKIYNNINGKWEVDEEKLFINSANNSEKTYESEGLILQLYNKENDKFIKSTIKNEHCVLFPVVNLFQETSKNSGKFLPKFKTFIDTNKIKMTGGGVRYI